MKFLPEWREVLKEAHSLWVQFAQAIFGLVSILDPAAALAVWNLMPDAVAARVPASFVTAVGVVLFALSLVTIVFRLTRQPKLEQKIKEKHVGNA